MEPAKGDIWMYGYDKKKLYYLLLECKPMKDKGGWRTLLLALNKEAVSDVEGTHIPYDWYRGSMFWKKVA